MGRKINFIVCTANFDTTELINATLEIDPTQKFNHSNEYAILNGVLK